MRSNTKSVCMIWLVCIWLTIIELYIWKKLLTYQYFSFESVYGEAMLKMGLMVKKYNFFILTALNWSKCILMVSIYIWLPICTNNETLRIIWKFDLSPRGVLGRIYALSIEVLCCKSNLYEKAKEFNDFQFYYFPFKPEKNTNKKSMRFLFIYNNIQYIIFSIWYEPPIFPYANNKATDKPAHPRSLISGFVVRCLDSIITLVSISEISSL